MDVSLPQCTSSPQIIRKYSYPRFHHKPITHEPCNPRAVRLGPGAFSAAGSKATRVSFRINAFDCTVNPAETERLLYRLFVDDAGFARRFLVVDQPDFLLCRVVKRKPLAPLCGSVDEQ